MEALAVVLNEPRSLALRLVRLAEPGEDSVVVEVAHTGISSGTERLLWQGLMPSFPGMGYPLVPGYETVGTVVDSRSEALKPGDVVFVPGAKCYSDVRALFGGAASRVITAASRVHKVDEKSPEMTLLALAATAYHAVSVGGAPELILGHGVLGRLTARISIALGHAPPRVHEISKTRQDSSEYEVIHPDADAHYQYRTVTDASGDHDVLDPAIARIAEGGTVTLAGFYGARMSFAFPAAFMREAAIKVAAQWKPDDLTGVRRLLDAGKLSLSGLISHEAKSLDADAAYAIAFNDPDCLKMVLNWGSVH
ncbi:MAG: chlorophyll synthesis pathway protein BchC [Pseudomonadota bacterium]